MVLVIGHLGNMGKRYCAILKMLRIEHFGIDGGYDPDLGNQLIRAADQIIVATPTWTHGNVLRQIAEARPYPGTKKVNVLCEKPVTKKPEEFEALRNLSGLRIFCVNQYAHLPEYEKFRGAQGRTYYNYFKHGDDGLAWDCFQLFNLAAGSITLNESSPIWRCRINGVEINQAGMDWAYVKMVQDFLGPMKRVWDLFTAEVTTKRVMKWMQEEQIPE